MTQLQLDRAVARATGESMATIARLGFVPLTEIPIERERLAIDWDDVDAILLGRACPQNSAYDTPRGKKRCRRAAHVGELRSGGNRADSTPAELAA